MTTFSVEDAQARLPELIRNMSPGDELIITAGSHPVARLITTNSSLAASPRVPRTPRGTVTYVASDFDAPLDDFKDYMP